MSERVDPDGGPSGVAEKLATLRARKGTLAVSFMVVMAATAAFTFTRHPVYRATSLLLIEPRRSNVANVQGVYDPTPASGTTTLDFYRTQYELLKSRRVVEPVALAFAKEGGPLAASAEPAESLTRAIFVDPIRESRLVRVSVEWSDARFAAAAANALVAQLIAENARRTLGVNDCGLQQLRTMEASLRPKQEAAAKALQRFKEANDIYVLDETQSSAAQRLRFLSDELTRVRSERARLAAERRQLQRELEGGAARVPSRSPSHVLEELLLQEAKAVEDREDLKKRYGPAHPRWLTLEARLGSIRAELARERRRLLDALDRDAAVLPENERELELAIDESKATLAELGRKAIRLQTLRGEADTAEASLRQVVRRIEEVELAMATDSTTENLYSVDKARAPAEPIRPRRSLDLGVGAFLGLALGVLACLLRGAPAERPAPSPAVPPRRPFPSLPLAGRSSLAIDANGDLVPETTPGD